jgi:hypothetical protein
MSFVDAESTVRFLRPRAGVRNREIGRQLQRALPGRLPAIG